MQSSGRISLVKGGRTLKNIPRIGKLPYRAKRGFIEKKIYFNKGFIEFKALLKVLE